jgi:hypothetical protein
MHVRLNSVGNNLQSSLHISGIRTSEKLSKVVMEYFLYFLIVCKAVPLIVIDKVYFVLSVPLTGFEMKELRVLVSMLEPITLSSLSPPLLFLMKQPI